MALIDCPECAQQISDQAASCPHCGFPISSASGAFENESDAFKSSKSKNLSNRTIENEEQPPWHDVKNNSFLRLGRRIEEELSIRSQEQLLAFTTGSNISTKKFLTLMIVLSPLWFVPVFILSALCVIPAWILMTRRILKDWNAAIDLGASPAQMVLFLILIFLFGIFTGAIQVAIIFLPRLGFKKMAIARTDNRYVLFSCDLASIFVPQFLSVTTFENQSATLNNLAGEEERPHLRLEYTGGQVDLFPHPISGSRAAIKKNLAMLLSD